MSLPYIVYSLTNKVDLPTIVKQANLAVVDDQEELVFISDNPEAFVLFAVASYIFQNPPAGKNPIVFPGGLPFAIG